MTSVRAGGRVLAVAACTGLVAVVAPLMAAGVVVLVTLTTLGLASPVGFVSISAFMTTAFPKAGVLLGGLPLPIMMFVLLLTAVMLRPYATSTAGHRPGRRLAAIGLAWLTYRLLAMYLDGASAADLLALAGWYGLPLVLLSVGPAVGALRGRHGALWANRLETGVLVACAFSLVQQVWGIEETAVPGITRAVGADYSTKPLQFIGGTKIPSTYQNGNILGVITAFFFLVTAERVLRGRGTPRDWLLMAGTAVATILSGSRTVLIGLILGLMTLVVLSGLNRRTVIVCLLAGGALFGVLEASPGLGDRILGTTASDPALAQRTVVWAKVLESTSIVELLNGGSVWVRADPDPGLAEGMIGAIQQVGVIGMVLFVGVVFAATSPRELRRWRFILIPVAVSLVADSAYLVFPTLFIPLARMFAPLRPEDSSPDEDDADAPVQEPQVVPA